VLKALRVPEHKLTVTGVRELPPYTELTVQCPSLLGAAGPNLPPTAWGTVYEDRRTRQRLKDRRIERELERGFKRPRFRVER